MPQQQQSHALTVSAVLQFGHDYEQARKVAKALAPRVMRMYAECQHADPRCTFVQFARTFDHTIPEHAADKDGKRGYRNHPTYAGLDYLRRITINPDHKYIECAWDAGHCDECGEAKEDHRYGDVVPESIR